MSINRKKIRIILIPIALFILIPMLVLIHPRARTALRLTPGFQPLKQDTRIFFEQGAEVYAELIAKALPNSIKKVEESHSLPFVSNFRVYVCSSHERFTRHIGQPVSHPVRGIAFPFDIWVSPIAFAFYGKDTHQQTVTHELSHLHISQYLGYWHRVKYIPAWFSEGLANWVADTGDERVSRQEAREGFFTGKHLVPDAAGRSFYPKQPRDYNLTWPIFHLQSRMFVEYLHAREKESFKRFVGAILGGAHFDIAFRNHFGDDLANVWLDFLDSLEVQSKDN